jgi:hypothetical protein
MDVAQITFLLFALFSSVRVVSYIPQILRVAQDSNGASAISYATWGLWTGANVSTAFYATVNLGDRWLSAVSSIYAACCLCVIALTFAKRRNVGRRLPGLLLRAASTMTARRAELTKQLRLVAATRAARVLGASAGNDASDLDIARICRRMAVCDVAWLVLRLALAVSLRLCGPHTRVSDITGAAGDGRVVSLPARQPSLETARCR